MVKACVSDAGVSTTSFVGGIGVSVEYGAERERFVGGECAIGTA